GMLADESRRARHGLQTTFVRVADVPADGPAPIGWASGAREIRIIGKPPTSAAAVARVIEIASVARRVPVSGFSLSDLEELAAHETVTLRSLLEDLRAVGLELVAEAPFDLLHDPRRSIEEVNIAGLALARLTIHQVSSEPPASLFKRVASLQRTV